MSGPCVRAHHPLALRLASRIRRASVEAERRGCEQARHSFERVEAVLAKERQGLRRERKKWKQHSAEYRYERDQAEARG